MLAYKKEFLQNLYRTMVRIRLFEEKVVECFLGGELPGFVHLYIGEEAIATGLLTELRAREFYEKPTAERKRKLAAAVKRHHKRMRSQTLPPKLY